ncbi:MAG: DUF3108 domain-containing protein [Dehalococcoidia bacterium]
MSVVPRVPARLLRCLEAAALGLAGLGLVACASPGTAQVVRISKPLPPQEALNYDLLDTNGHQLGSAVVSLRQAGDALVLSQNYTDLQQHTDSGAVTVSAATMAPRSAHRELNTGSVRSTLDVTYSSGKVTSMVTDGKDVRHTAAVTSSSYDDQESFFLLRTLDFTPGASVRFGIVVVDAAKGTISRALGAARVEGMTKITMHGRQFSAWQVQLTGAGTTNTAWYDAGDPNRRMLRYINGRQTQLELANP